MEKRSGRVGEILRKLCEWKGVKIIEAECCPDHIHMRFRFYGLPEV